MKYVILEVSRDGQPMLEVPFVFPDFLVHKEVADSMRLHICVKHSMDGVVTSVKPVGAGFLASPDFHHCHGESESLKLKSRGKVDDRLISMCDYGSMHL